MSVFVVPVDSTVENEEQEADVTNQEIILGRSFLIFSCNDMRISRNQGILKHRGDSMECVTIKSTHSNPIYYKVDGNDNIEILVKEKEVFLKHGDQFGFLPDKCWFKISIKKTENPEAALMLRVRPVAELNDSQNLAEIIPQVTNNQPNVAGDMSQEVSSQDLIVLPTPDFNFHILPESSVKREAEEGVSGSPKRQKTDEAPTSSTTDVPCQSTTSSKAQTDACSSTTTVKKEEPDSTDSLRDSCQFGVGCYRHNIEHRREFAHPGDTDYRRPDFPPAPPGTPMCPYGARCYRRHPDHFVEFAHPPSSIYLSGPASCNDPASTSSTNSIPAWLPVPRRQPKTETTSDVSETSSNQDDFSADDDDDEEFELNMAPQESSSESDIEESDDNSAILDDGDANED